MARPLPAKSPVPIAPPRPIITTWPRLRLWRSPRSRTAMRSARSASVSMALPPPPAYLKRHGSQRLGEAFDFAGGVVVDQRRPHGAAVDPKAQPLHQTRRVHVAVPGADVRRRQAMRHRGRISARQVEAEGRYALV